MSQAALRLSKSERDFIDKGVEQNCRNDGRERLAGRMVEIEKGIAVMAAGSARCHAHDGSELLVTVKADVITVNSAIQQFENGTTVDERCIVVNSKRLNGKASAGEDKQYTFVNAANQVQCNVEWYVTSPTLCWLITNYTT